MPGKAPVFVGQQRTSRRYSEPLSFFSRQYLTLWNQIPYFENSGSADKLPFWLKGVQNLLERDPVRPIQTGLHITKETS
jgi:hypothetical protein